MYKHSRNLSTGGGSLKDESQVQIPGYPLPKLRRKHSEGDILEAATGASRDKDMSESGHGGSLSGAAGVGAVGGTTGSVFDEIDSLPSSLRFNLFDISCIVFSMITYTLDLGMDLYIAYIYYTGQWIAYFILTLCFVIIPAGTMTAFSLRWYVMDMDSQAESRKSSSGRWVIRTIFLLLQLAPVLRYIDSLIYGIKSRKAASKNDKFGQLKYYTLMVNEDADATLLRLFEGFMESAPQVTLQLYIFITHFNNPNGPFTTNNVNIQAGAIITSLVSLAWSLSSYHRSLRYAQADKSNISYKGTILQFLWHFFSISARVLALAVFASSYSVLIIPACVAHWVAMVVWLIIQGNVPTCGNQCEETVFLLVVAFVYIFTFFNIRDEPTRFKYLTYYLICFIENTVLLFMWFFLPGLSFTLESWKEYGDKEKLWLGLYALASDFILFFLGIIAMILYYVYFHPSLTDKLFLKMYDIEHPRPSFMATGATEPITTTTAHKPPIRQDFLTRKGSLDHGSSIPLSLGISGAGSNPSSRRNVTFAMDLRKPREKATRSNSCGDPAPKNTTGVKFQESDTETAQQQSPEPNENSSQSQPLLPTSAQSQGQGGREETSRSSNGVKSTKETNF